VACFSGSHTSLQRIRRRRGESVLQQALGSPSRIFEQQHTRDTTPGSARVSQRCNPLIT